MRLMKNAPLILVSLSGILNFTLTLALSHWERGFLGD